MLVHLVSPPSLKTNLEGTNLVIALQVKLARPPLAPASSARLHSQIGRLASLRAPLQRPDQAAAN